MNKKTLYACFLAGIFLFQNAYSQTQWGEIHGNFENTVQYYNPDSAIGAPPVPEKLLSNGFANFIYTYKNFEAGIRYESYLNALQGFDPNYQGNGIPYRYARYRMEKLDFTVGNFYEQFGSGMIFRTYEERGLGIDNAMDGIRVKYAPVNGIRLTGVIGKQRLFFDYGSGIVRGLDGEIMINELSEKLSELKPKILIGGSFVSKYQEDKNPSYVLPENVGAAAARMQLTYGRFSLMGEYAYKLNDPSNDNRYVYKHGEALLASTSYSTKGLGITLSGKVIDNMSFRSNRDATINDLMINYMPALTRQHTYNLAATLYPYATQPTGEAALQADIIYTIPKGSTIGGKYGTNIAINYSRVQNADTTEYPNITDPDSTRLGYRTNFFGWGDQVYFEDFNIEITRKLNKQFKLKLMYMHFIYNMEVVQQTGTDPIIHGDIGVVDFLYKINMRHSLRTELQYLATKHDQGDWATGLLEYSYSPHWFVAVIDQYNIGNPKKDKQIHYITGTVGYNNKGNRFMLSYGRQRAGVFCVGGVCRNVPASNGVTFTVTSSF